QGHNGEDTYIFGVGYGHDTINDGADNLLAGQTDLIRFGSGLNSEDLRLTRASDDLIISFEGLSDVLTIEGQFDFVETGVFGVRSFTLIETFEFADGTVLSWIDVTNRLIEQASTDGDDMILGSHFDDVIDGGAGNDVLNGANGEDTYVFGRGYGHDRIEEFNDNLLSGTHDSVDLVGLNRSDITLSSANGGLDIIVTINDTGETLTIDNQNWSSNISFSSYRIEAFHFADGTTWDFLDLNRETILDQATDGDDIVQGFFTDDTLDGGAGDDALSGGDGDDTYIFARGSGHDTIHESVAIALVTDDDTVSFGEGISLSDLFIERPVGTDDLTFTILDTGETLTIVDQFKAVPSGFWNDVETFTFADGTSMGIQEIIDHIAASATTDGDDVITGTTLDDTLIGGLGDDTLNGDKGDDTYIYRRGDGHDIVNDAHAASSGPDHNDRVRLINIDPLAVTVSAMGADILLTIADSAPGAADGGTLTLIHAGDVFFGRGVDAVAFDDGTVWSRADLRIMAIETAETDGDDVVTGFNTEDTLEGGLGNDTLIGREGSDTYVYTRGEGDDVIDDDHTSLGADGIDTLILHDIAVSDVSVVFEGGENVLIIAESAPGAGDGGRITLTHTNDDFHHKGVDRVAFDDGTVWTAADIRTMGEPTVPDGFDAIFFGTSGDDTWNAGNGRDYLIGGGGDDTLKGRGGADLYLYDAGDGNDLIHDNSSSRTAIDTLEFADLNASDVAFSRSARDLFIDIVPTGEQIRIQDQFFSTYYNYGIEAITFADGSSLTHAEINNSAWYRGTDGDDRLQGSNTNERFDGLAGDDYIFGNSGADTIYGRDGNDELRGGYGNDLIYGGAGDDLIIAWHHNDTAHGGAGNDTIEGYNGYDILNGDDGDDIIDGGAHSDVLNGGAGNDRLTGGSFDDTFVFDTASFGHDTITDYLDNREDLDFRGSGLTFADLTISQSGGNTLIATANDESTITLLNTNASVINEQDFLF
ncbi:MAG: calcium-binding protein, partial [Pseudomonadota bacterium]